MGIYRVKWVNAYIGVYSGKGILGGSGGGGGNFVLKKKRSVCYFNRRALMAGYGGRLHGS